MQLLLYIIYPPSPPGESRGRGLTVGMRSAGVPQGLSVQQGAILHVYTLIHIYIQSFSEINLKLWFYYHKHSGCAIEVGSIHCALRPPARL